MFTMSVVAPPFSSPHHRHCRRYTIPRNSKQHPLIPKASLSLSQQTHYSSTSQLSLLRQINTLCESKNLAQAFDLLQQSLENAEEDPADRAEAMGMLLQASGQEKDIEIGSKVHEIIWKSTRYEDNVVLNTRIITMYSNCGFPSDSRFVFDQLETKNLYQWNALISGYTKNELWFDAVLVFCELLLVSDYRPDNFTFPCVVKACGGIKDLGLGQSVHGLGLKMDLASDVFFGNALIACYGKCGMVEEAIKMFEYMPERNVVSWNALFSVYSESGMIQECTNLFRVLLEREECLIPDVVTLVTLLPVCAAEGEVYMGKQIHSLAVKLELSKELMVNNALIDMYSKCGYLIEARKLFDKNDRNVVSWNSIIAAYSRGGDVCKTFDILRKMQVDDDTMKANEVSILNVLPVCLEKSQLFSVKVLHGYSLRHGFQCDELLANAFIGAYAKCGSFSSAVHVYDIMENKTVSSWNALIGGFAQNGDPTKAINMYVEMASSGLAPDLFSIASLLLACAELRSLQNGKAVHGFLLKNDLVTDLYISVSLISLYINCGKPLYAKVLFEGMENKSLVSWNAMISGYSQNGLPYEALKLFRGLTSSGIQPDQIALTSVLGVCSQLSASRLGKEIHSFALKADLIEDTFVGSSVIDMYAHGGSIEQCQRVFDQLKKRDVAAWTCLITGYGIHGHGKEALKLFQEMQRLGLRPDDFTFIGILIACNHAGLIDEGVKCLNEMQTLHGVEQKLEHYACVIDMLGRAGRFLDALELIDKMPEEPDAAIWNSLLSSCRFHNELDLGRKFAEKLLELEPNKAENYVLISNFFAGSGKWDDVQRVRHRMKEIGLQKAAGLSWIEVEGKTYSFVVGDKLLPLSEEIHKTWRSLENRISEIGYVPDRGSVLHELKEDEKLELLRGHSEKLAISFGLLKTTKGTTLRIFKNLRICGDCHNAAKLVSKVVDREIIVRDNKRFHHFRNGICSCGNYW